MNLSNFEETLSRCGSKRREGALLIELLVAMALLTAALLPIAYSFASERRYARSAYQRAVAIELVDGEMETLLAGEWRSYGQGSFDYKPRGRAAGNLAPGRFVFNHSGQKLRLMWKPEFKDHGGPVVREGVVQ
jgi:hypothetical protein